MSPSPPGDRSFAEALRTTASESRRIQGLVLAGICGAVISAFVWIAVLIGSTAELDPNHANANYNLLVRGFQAGHLSLEKEAPAGLKQLSNPYDPAANGRFRAPPYLLHDVTYYRGKLYLYFGVVPALVLFWPWAALTGHYLSHLQAAVVFSAAGFLASVSILVTLWRRAFSGVSLWVIAACALALGLATGVPILLQRPDMYEVAILSGFAFAMLALAALLLAFHHRERQPVWLASASFLYGLALGSRPSLVFGAVVLLLPVADAWRAPSAGTPRWRVPCLLGAAIGPITCVGIGLMIYNFLRFDNPLEFGHRYQMSADPAGISHFGVRYLWLNVRVYFLEPVHLGRNFPFLTQIGLPEWMPGHAHLENPYGVLTNVPIVWLTLAAPLGLRSRASEPASRLLLVIASVGLFFGACAFPLCCFMGLCYRYEAEFLPALVLLSVLGVLGLERAYAAHPSWLIRLRWTWTVLLVVSVAFNLLSCFQNLPWKYYNRGEQLAQMGRVPEAISSYEQALRREPGYVQANAGLGYTLVREGRLSDAIPHFEAVLKSAPDDLRIQNDLAISLARTGRYLDAIEYFGRMVRAHPDLYGAQLNLAMVLERAGRIREALGVLERVMRLRPDLEAARSDYFRLRAILESSGPDRTPNLKWLPK